jgi:hypothetical protein
MATNPNMEAIQTVTATTSVAYIEFTNIPQTYTDLCVFLSNRSTSSGSDVYITFNTSGGTYSGTRLLGNGSSASSDRVTNGTLRNNSSASTASTFTNSYVYIPNYAGSNKKSYSVDSVAENNGTAAVAQLSAGLWDQTSAITKITFTPDGGNNFAQYSTATLYGITAFIGEESPKAIGGIVTSDTNYWYHTFINTGNFTPSQSVTADVLVVAGGGCGGSDSGGGGGAGGYRTSTGLSLTASNYAVIVGAGGSAAISGSVGSSGSNSVFSSITSSGGGRGGDRASNYPNGTAGANGGSGGGGGGAEQSPGRSAGSGNSGSYSPSEGNNGGVGIGPAGSFAGGGGGGAGGTGSAATGSTNGGAGGTGSYTVISGGSATGRGVLSGGNYYFAGGGGGGGNASAGSGGTGGGGAGSSVDTSGNSGVANTGGGGGGAGNSSNSKYGGNGGSGIIIIRYAK